MGKEFSLDEIAARCIFEIRDDIFKTTRQHLQQLRNLALEILEGAGEELVTFRQEPGQTVALPMRSLSLDNPGLSDFIIQTSSGPKPQAETIYLNKRGIPVTLVLPGEGQLYFTYQPTGDAVRPEGEGLVSREVSDEEIAILLRCLSECKTK